jgi:hypothetical protein
MILSVKADRKHVAKEGQVQPGWIPSLLFLMLITVLFLAACSLKNSLGIGPHLCILQS